MTTKCTYAMPNKRCLQNIHTLYTKRTTPTKYKLVSWCFEPSQPLGVTSGLNTNSNLSLNRVQARCTKRTASTDNVSPRCYEGVTYNVYPLSTKRTMPRDTSLCLQKYSELVQLASNVLPTTQSCLRTMESIRCLVHVHTRHTKCAMSLKSIPTLYPTNDDCMRMLNKQDGAYKVVSQLVLLAQSTTCMQLQSIRTLRDKRTILRTKQTSQLVFGP